MVINRQTPKNHTIMKPPQNIIHKITLLIAAFALAGCDNRQAERDARELEALKEKHRIENEEMDREIAGIRTQKDKDRVMAKALRNEERARREYLEALAHQRK